MAKVYVMHNVVKDYDPSRMMHRNCFDYNAFDQWLQHRSEKFISLSLGLQNNNGECITIDDATVGAFDAAMLCAAHHHYATIFINPYYIVNKKQYWTHYLSLFIEQIEVQPYAYKEEYYDLSRLERRKKLRKTIKGDLSKIAYEEERIAMLEQVFNRKSDETQLPYHLQTMSEDQLDLLAENEYISIEYHGWTHGEIAAMPFEQIKQELELGRTWFRQRLKVEINYFSLPFGKRQKQIEGIDNLPFVLMDDRDYSDEFGNERLHNRIPLEITR